MLVVTILFFGRGGHLNASVVIESAQESRLMSKMTALLLAGAVAVIVITAKATHQAGTESANGLRMSLAHDEDASGGPGKPMDFTVTFSNTKREDVTFIPGMLVDCGRAPSKTSLVTLTLTDSRGKRHRHLPYLGGDGPPYQGACAGILTLFLVVLHPGESLSLPLDIDKYLDLSDSTQYEEARFPAGKYSLQAELREMPSQSNVATTKHWVGTVSSNILEVGFDSEFAAPLDDYFQ
jgi:hypothetical protein